MQSTQSDTVPVDIDSMHGSIDRISEVPDSVWHAPDVVWLTASCHFLPRVHSVTRVQTKVGPYSKESDQCELREAVSAHQMSQAFTSI